MNELSDFVRRAAFWTIGVGVMIIGAVFAVSLFLAVLLIAAFGVLGALLSGRKPAPFVIWSRWREMQARSRFGNRARDFRNGFGRAGAAASRKADVVDVQARDIEGAAAPRDAATSRR